MEWLYERGVKVLRWWFDLRISGRAILAADSMCPNSEMFISKWEESARRGRTRYDICALSRGFTRSSVRNGEFRLTTAPTGGCQ